MPRLAVRLAARGCVAIFGAIDRIAATTDNDRAAGRASPFDPRRSSRGPTPSGIARPGCEAIPVSGTVIAPQHALLVGIS